MKGTLLTFGRRVFKWVLILSAVAIIGVSILFTSLWLEHSTEITLPRPSGPFPVGRTILDWADEKTLGALAPTPATKRELQIWIWFPASEDAKSRPASYLPDPLPSVVENERGMILGKFLTHDLAKVHGHSLLDPDVSQQQQSYPVIIMRGGASAEVWNYTALAEDLASHGYIVVGFDAAYRSNVVIFHDGRVIQRRPENNPELCLGQSHNQEQCIGRILNAWTTDTSFVLDRLVQLNTSDPSQRFTGRLDMTRVGVFGHSLGGATALQFCHDDSRCKTGVDLDGAPHGNVIQTGLHQPFMFLMSDHSHETDPASGEIMANIKSIYDRLPEGAKLQITIRGANHFTFSDDGALLKSHALRGLLRAFGILKINGDRQLAATSYCLQRFFDTYLKNGPAVQLNSMQYQELEISH